MKLSKEKKSKFFACAFFELEKKSSERGVYLSGLQDIVSLLDVSTKLRSFLESPLFSQEERHIFFSSTHIPKPVTIFLELIIEKKMIFHLKSIVRHYEHLVLSSIDKIKVKAVVSHSSYASKEIENSLVKKLKDVLKKDIDLKFHINPKILGGFLLQADDLYIDSSLRKSLEDIKASL